MKAPTRVNRAPLSVWLVDHPSLSHTTFMDAYFSFETASAMVWKGGVVLGPYVLAEKEVGK